MAGEEGRQAVNLRAGQLFAERALQRPLEIATEAAVSGVSAVAINNPPPPRQARQARKFRSKPSIPLIDAQ